MNWEMTLEFKNHWPILYTYVLNVETLMAQSLPNFGIRDSLIPGIKVRIIGIHIRE